MVLGILAVIAVLAIAFYHTTQGLFSSLIMTLLTVLCAAFAFNLYRPMAAMMYPKHAPYAMALCLMALFAGSLFALRMIVDIVLRPNVTFHEWVDRIAGGVFGFFTGMIIVGMAMVALQLLPFGPSVLGYKPFDETLQRRQHLGPFRPDEFALGLVSALSRGTLGAGADFAADHEDFALRAFCYRNRAERRVSMTCPADSVEVVGVWQLGDDDDDKPWQDALADLADPLLTDEENAESRIVIVRLAVAPAVAGDKKVWMLPATHFRLIYHDGRSFYPLAYLTYPSGKDARSFRARNRQWRIWAAQSEVDPVTRLKRPRVADLIVLRHIRAESRRDSDGWLVVDWVYRLPAVEAVEADPDQQDPPAVDEDATAIEDADEDAQEADDSLPAEPPMLLVFRRGIELTIKDIQLGLPPMENALSHNRKPARGAD